MRRRSRISLVSPATFAAWAWSAAALLPLASQAQGPASMPEADRWRQVTMLDTGPSTRMRNQEEARRAAMAHLERQEKALREYVQAEPRGAHIFEAKLRLARLLQLRANFKNEESGRIEAANLLDEAAASATTPVQRTELEFSRIAFTMRTLKAGNAHDREELLTKVRRFQVEHADDRRLPALLAEVATLFDREPETKRALLTDARTLNKDPGLKGRIEDDLKKLEMLGKVVDAEIPRMGSSTTRLAQFRGKVVFLLFFAEFSPPSVEALLEIKRLSAFWPADKVQVIAYSIDSDDDELQALLRRENIPFIIGWDGSGWHGPTPRALGINTLPTAWILDQEGRLRSLRGMDGAKDAVLHLVQTGGQ